jgi:CRP/FNR family cyclic AMP-dependent transcriptional regulator
LTLHYREPGTQANTTEGVHRIGSRTRTIVAMADILALSAHLPEIELNAGDTLVTEGGAAAGLWVLVSGSLQVCKGNVPINTITRSGALIGEVSLLLDSAHTATVNATERCVVRHAADGNALLSSHPDITRLVAVGLAERLHFVTTYLADLKHQYGDVPGLAMVSDVLSELAQRQAPPARPGSAREPDPDY